MEYNLEILFMDKSVAMLKNLKEIRSDRYESNVVTAEGFDDFRHQEAIRYSFIGENETLSVNGKDILFTKIIKV
jgi:hypothetical protein